MNPYLQIARDHLSTEELEMLLAEKKRPMPEQMTPEQELYNRYYKTFEKTI